VAVLVAHRIGSTSIKFPERKISIGPHGRNHQRFSGKVGKNTYTLEFITSKIGQQRRETLASFRSSAIFSDISEAGRGTGFELGFRQLDCGPQAIPASLQLGEHVSLVQMSFDRAYHQLGSPPKGMAAFGVPVRRLRNWCGRDYEASSILPFNVRSGIDGVSEPGFQAFTPLVMPALATQQ
jgi:hypothetical protein